MASEWHETTLGHVIELKRGYDLPKKARSPGNVPLVSSSGVTDYNSEAMVKGPGVVTGRYGTLGQVFYVKEDFWPLNTTLYVRDFKGNDPRFLSYFLRGLDFLAYSDKAAVPGLNRNHLHQAKVCIPLDVREQRAIAHILGTLDDKIELSRRMNETLEEMARAIFKSWFVDFDPVRAKMEGRQPVGMDDEVAALFPDSFENSALGEIPRGWSVEFIGEAVKVMGGGTPSTKEPSFWEDGTHCWATPKDLSKLQSPVLLDTERKVTDAGLAKISSGLLPVGTVLLSSRAPIGYLAVARVPVAVNQGFIAMLCNGSLTTHYMLHWTRINVEQIKGRAGGSTFPEISKKNFRTMLVLAPPRELLSAFEAQVVSLYGKMSANLRHSSTLTAVRDALLPKLLSGEVRVKEAV